MGYQEFYRRAKVLLSKEERRSTNATIASKEDLEWRKRYELERAMEHIRASQATREDIHLVRSK